MLVAEREQGLTAELLDPLRSGLVWRGRPPRLAEVRGLSPSEILLGRRHRRTRHAAASRRGRPAAADDRGFQIEREEKIALEAGVLVAPIPHILGVARRL
jgi:hypothetical protein